jgi:hypothetical protein
MRILFSVILCMLFIPVVFAQTDQAEQSSVTAYYPSGSISNNNEAQAWVAQASAIPSGTIVYLSKPWGSDHNMWEWDGKKGFGDQCSQTTNCNIIDSDYGVHEHYDCCVDPSSCSTLPGGASAWTDLGLETEVTSAACPKGSDGCFWEEDGWSTNHPAATGNYVRACMKN